MNDRVARGLAALIALSGLSACMTQVQRNAREFVQRDALGDAENTASERCHGGSFELIPGERGYSPDDYRCTAALPADAPAHPHMDAGARNP